MSILDTQKVDLVAARSGSNVVKLVIMDHLPWDDIESHGRLLQEKINAYIAFVESGQLASLEEPPIPASPAVRITLAAQHPPTEQARAMLRSVEEFLRGVGIGFDLEVHSAI